MEPPAKIAILLLDDSRSDAKLTAHWLRRSRTIGRVHVAHEAAAALAVLRDRRSLPEADRPQLLLLDLNLRGVSGFEVLRQIRSDAELAPLPVIILSGSAFAEDRQRAAELRAGLYLTKPADAAEFERFVDALDDFCGARFFPPAAPG